MQATRRLKEAKNGNDKTRKELLSKQKRKGKHQKVSSLNTLFISFCLCAIILTIFTCLYLDSFVIIASDKIAVHLGYSNPVHAVIIDAGSTGSRVLAFTFHKAFLDNRLILDKELFSEIKPGLSSYADNPDKGAASIGQLLEKAKIEIPEKYWANTPLVLKATAGLRLLPEKKANGILEAVANYFKTVPFATNEESVTIMDGIDEGIFSWVTVNFLKGLLNGSAQKTVAALDLGGGSTQVTFAAIAPSTLTNKNDIHLVPIKNDNITVYTHSFLSFGLMAARKEILQVESKTNPLQLISECVNPIINNTQWHYGGKMYHVSGSKENIQYTTEPANGVFIAGKHPIVKFEKCLSSVKKYVKSMVQVPEELGTKNINAFSYYYDRAVESGLIDPFTGGIITVAEYLQAAKKVANIPNTEQPFICLDLTYIYVLLKDGFGLKDNTKLSLLKQIDGHEVSWALGVASHLLQK